MPEEVEKIEINSITKHFNKAIEMLISKGVQPNEIMSTLGWKKSAYSLYTNNNRNVPVEKWELLLSVYKIANPLQVKGVELETTIGGFEERIIGLESQTEVYKTTIAAMLTSEGSKVSNDPLLVSEKIESLNSLIDDTINRRLGKPSKK